MKIYEITDITHDDEEHESIVETYLFLNQNEALEKFKELCEDRIDQIIDDNRDEYDDDEYEDFETDVREGLDMSAHIFEFYNLHDYGYTTIILQENEVS